MRVLMFGWEFPPHISGGLGTACYGLTKGMTQDGDISINFVVPKAYGDEGQERVNIIGAADISVDRTVRDYHNFLTQINLIELNSNLKAYSTPEEYEKLSQKNKNNIKFIDTSFKGKYKFKGGYGETLYQEIANYALVASELAKKGDFEVIHAHDWLTFSAGIAAKKISGKPLVIHVHATDFDRSGGKVNPTVYAIERNGMMEADCIIAVSNLTRKIIIEKYHIPAHKVVTVHNAIEHQSIPEVNTQSGTTEKIVTFLGRITMQKGPEYFIEAAKRVLDMSENVRFVMAGNGDMMNKMVTRVAQLGIGHKFNFTGFLRGEEVYKMLSISDVYVMPSISEPFGISPLEAMKTNVPIIISKQSGVAEVVKHAIKIDYWDVDALANAIYGVIHYKGVHKMFLKYGREEVEKMKWEDAARKIKKIYNELI